MRKSFDNFHRMVEVLLGRFFSKQKKGSRVTISSFVDYIRNHRDTKPFLKTFGHERLRKTISHALESGAYSGYRLSVGEGIVKTSGYKKDVRISIFEAKIK